MCLWNTNAPNNDQFQRWLRTNYLIHAAAERSQEILMWDIKTLALTFENLLFSLHLFSLHFSTICQTKRSRSLDRKCWYPRKGLGNVIGMLIWNRNFEALALTVLKLLARLEFSKVGRTPRSKFDMLVTTAKSWYSIKALTFTVQMLLMNLKFFKKWVKLKGQK